MVRLAFCTALLRNLMINLILKSLQFNQTRLCITHSWLSASQVVCPSRDEEPFSSSMDITKRLLPHPSDCRRFYFCETTIPRPLICEEHLAFDLETLSCIDKSLVHRWWLKHFMHFSFAWPKSKVPLQNACFFLKSENLKIVIVV